MFKIVVNQSLKYGTGANFKSNPNKHFEPGIKDVTDLHYRILEIAQKYRNPAAHKDGITITTLNECREMMLTTTKVIKNLLSILN